MKSALVFALFGIASLAFGGQDPPARPKITGIDHVAFYTTAPQDVAHLYHDLLGLAAMDPAEAGETIAYAVGKQWVGYSIAPDAQTLDRMNYVAFATDDILALQHYLKAKGVAVPAGLERWQDGSRSFRVNDPEGYTIEFVERAKEETKPDSEALSRRVIHVGFVVRNRQVEDGFYKDILGFHVYWYGGSKPGITEWCAMQVPNGTDWLEYMLGVSAHPDRQELGVMNHVSLGVVNMKETAAKLESRGWKPHDDERQQMGLDGKWQLNLYDPDLTRVELMEFRPVQKPCCSEFHGPFPGPDR